MQSKSHVCSASYHQHTSFQRSHLPAYTRARTHTQPPPPATHQQVRTSLCGGLWLARVLRPVWHYVSEYRNAGIDVGVVLSHTKAYLYTKADVQVRAHAGRVVLVCACQFVVMARYVREVWLLCTCIPECAVPITPGLALVQYS